MTNKYISIRHGKYLVKNELESFLLFYKYFLFRPLLPGILLRRVLKFFDTLVVLKVKIFFISRMNKLVPTQKLHVDFLVYRRGGGVQKNICTVEKKSNGYVLNKIFTDSLAFEREKKFLILYNKKSNTILFPSFKILENKIIYTLLTSESLKSLIRRGQITKKQTLEIYKKLFNIMTPLYEKNSNYQHGDLATENIYPVNDTIYLIDFADSTILPRYYDMIFLLYRIVTEFNHITYAEFLSNAVSIFGSLNLNATLTQSDITNFDKTYKRNFELKYGKNFPE